MIIHNSKQYNKYLDATKYSTEILKQLYDKVEIGITPIEIDNYAFQLCKKKSVIPSFVGVKNEYGDPYKNATCISVNDTILHGIPQNKPIQNGDLVKVDFGIIYQEYYTDHCFTVGVGEVSQEHQNLLKIGKEAVLAGVKQTVSSNRVGDIGYAISNVAHTNGYNTLRNYTGHSLGKTLHESPLIPTFGKQGKGSRLKENMVLCIEAQLIKDNPAHYQDSDRWSIKSTSGEYAVMFEYMVIVRPNQPEIITPTQNWDLIKS